MENIDGLDCWCLYDLTCAALGNNEIAYMLSSFFSVDEMESFIGWIWAQYDLYWDCEHGCIAVED